MRVLLEGEVLAVQPTRNGGAVRVIVRDNAIRNAVVLLPPSLAGVDPKPGERISVAVRASVDHAADGHLIDSVTWMYADWPRKQGGE